MQLQNYVIQMEPELRPGWMREDGFVAPLVGFEAASAPGAVVASATDERGTTRPLVTRTEGSYRCHFDVEGTMAAIRREQYPGGCPSRPFVTRLPFDYNEFPAWLIGIASRLMSRPVEVEKLPRFPAYPSDRSVDLLRVLGQGDPRARPLRWPDGYRYAVVLTHDVDTAWLLEHPPWLERFASVEEAHGFRSAWYIVPKAVRSEGTRKGLAELVERGHEIGAHGLTHDPGLADLPEGELEEKFTRGRRILEPYIRDAIGYRAPWLSRSRSMYRGLAAAGYLYDTSRPNADFFRNHSASNNGCGTMYPYVDEGVVILPITLPQDSMRKSLGMSPRQFWDWILELAETVKEIGGIAVISTHPQPHHAANPAMLEGYESVVKTLGWDREAWKTLPRTAAAWARQRLA